MLKNKYHEITTASEKAEEELQREIDGYKSVLLEIKEVSRRANSYKKSIKELEVDGITIGNYEKYQNLINQFKKEISELQDLYYAISDMVMSKCENTTKLLRFLEEFEGEEYKLQFNADCNKND